MKTIRKQRRFLMRFTREDYFRMRQALEKHEGFTWDLVFNDIIEDFWMIGGASKELIIIKDRLRIWDAKDMDKIINHINDLMEGFSSLNPLMDLNPSIRFNALGGWIDKKGDLIIEISQGVKDTMDAIRLGIQRKQKSIYHLKRGELISLDEIRALIEEA
jgi:hypothetical protein